MPSLESWRDIAIIILALMNLVWLGALIVVLFMVYKKLLPLLTSATATVQNIQATTTFIAETTVSPVIRVLSFVAGVRAAAGTVGRMKRRKGDS